MFIGLDLGTSGLKALLIDEDQSVLAEATAPLSVSRPASGWSEQEPDDWCDACDAAMQALKAKADLSAVKGIGLSGQMHGATLIDADDKPLRPCMLWNDTRASAQAAQFDAIPAFRDVTGNIVFPGFTAPKVDWVRQNEPTVFAKMRKVLLPKDYLRLYLTGEYMSEMSDAAGTSWLDTGARDWSDVLLAKCDLSRDHMPSLVEGSAISGELRASLTERWGLPKGVVVAGGAGDNAATAIGLGVAEPGDGFVSLGTSGVLFAASSAFQPDAATAVHTFCHALPGTWHQMGVILAATDALNWLSQILGKSPAELTANLGALAAPTRVTFLPYLGGERTPHNNADVRASFTGLEHATGPEDLTRAVLEGVAFAFRDSQDALEATGTELHRLIGAGGGANATYWVEAIATALNLAIDLPGEGDFGAAFGAARLGQMAATGEAELSRPAVAQTISPNSTLTEAYAEAHARYKSCYAALKGQYA
ncbi:MAG: xylulokinase [Pseudomonadota bacterium]